MSIQILPSHVSDQIAAGEVVERPASVVKELVENALDAGATHIEVRIEEGGKKLIEVRDNGSGMDREDAHKCILRYATSKIHSIDDIFRIQSFGFRGEALAAICAVSRFELTTKCRDAINRVPTIGTKVKVSGGGRPEVSDVPANDGTLIRVQDLFYTTPARLAYLKTDETENRSIMREMQNFALANPEKSFKLFRDGKLVLDFPATDEPQRMAQVLKNNAASLLSCSGMSQTAKISGFVSRPGDCIASRKSQFLFVNGRAIEDHKISFAVREGYVQSAGIEKHLHPIFVLFLDIDPILVDVNVHPRKLEVKFSEPQEIFALVKKSIANACLPREIVPTRRDFTGQGGFHGYAPASPSRNFQEQSKTRDESPTLFQKDDSIGGETFPHLQLVGQVAHRYIAAESAKGLYLFDQHALHERQRFEQFWNEWKTSKTKIQKLLTPQVFRFSEESISLLHEHRSVLAELGFGVAFSRDDEVAVSEVPQIFGKNELEDVFEKLIEYFSSERIGESAADVLMRKLIEYKSCRGAVMFGDALKPQEMQKLLDDFHTTQWHNLCPHGRPNHIFLPFEKLDKEFHR